MKSSDSGLCCCSVVDYPQMETSLNKFLKINRNGSQRKLSLFVTYFYYKQLKLTGVRYAPDLNILCE